MNKVFADTYYYLALLVARDETHQLAVELTQQLRGQIVYCAREQAEVLIHKATRSYTKKMSDFMVFLRALSGGARGGEKAQFMTVCSITTGWVLLEFANAVSKSRRRHYFPSLWDDPKQNPQMIIIPPDEALFEEGTELYRARPDKEWSLTDCISFLVMEREGITEALTGDHHFEQAGFKILFK